MLMRQPGPAVADRVGHQRPDRRHQRDVVANFSASGVFWVLTIRSAHAVRLGQRLGLRRKRLQARIVHVGADDLDLRHAAEQTARMTCICPIGPPAPMTATCRRARISPVAGMFL